MPRRSRIVLPGLPHHVTQRGNYRQKVFENTQDYAQYSEWMNEYSQKNMLEILAYCLMGNHVHFIVVPKSEESLARTFNTAHMRYAQYMNRKHKTLGHLWQGRFYSCILDEAHLYRAIRYVERNPVRARQVKHAWDYPWSSAPAHAGEGESLIYLSATYRIMKKEEWRGYLTEEDNEMCLEMRLKTQRGAVAGTREFIARLEQKLHRSLACLNPGRPRKVDRNNRE